MLALPVCQVPQAARDRKGQQVSLEVLEHLDRLGRVELLALVVHEV